MKKVKLRSISESCFLLLFFLFTYNFVVAQDLNPGAWPHLKGYWKFQSAGKLTKATVGKDLSLTGTHQYIPGPSVGDTAIRIGIGSYYKCTHTMAPNGGGDSVNRYTLMFDFKVLSFKKWHTFFKTDSNNNNDGECFIRPLSGTNPGRIGVAATGYSKDSINPNQWYRLMISVNLDHYYRYYINGKLFHEGDTQEVDGRFALTPKMIFFGDDNQEDDTIDVASVAVFDTCLSAGDIAKIGSIDPCIANPPRISLGRDTILCDYHSIVKNAGPGFKKYQWSTGSLQQTVTLTKSIGMGKKNVWCRVTDQNGCVFSDTFTLQYQTSPILNLGTDQAFCHGNTIKLTAGTDTSCKYLWQFLPNGHTLSSNMSITTDSAGKYAATATTIFGCISRDTVQITVYIRPAKPLISITGKTNLCQGQNVILSAPIGYFDYSWTNGANMPFISVSKDDILKVKVIDSNNCSSVYSDSIIVKVFALPPKPKIKVTGNTYFCEGDSVTLELPSGYIAYKWQDFTYLSTSRNIHSAGLYYAYVTDKNDCNSPNSDSILVKVNALPAKPLIQLKGNTELCQGEWAVLSAPSGFKSYKWSPDNHATQSDTVKTSGQYIAAVEDTNGCFSKWSDFIDIVVHPLPSKPIIILSGNDKLQSNVSSNNYKWFRNGQTIQDSTQIISGLSNAYYQVQIKNDWCWSVLSDSFLYQKSDIDKMNLNPEIASIYPNPADADITVKFINLNVTEGAWIEITDMLGEKVYYKRISSTEISTGTTTICLKQLGPGIYHLKILTTDGIITRKIEKL